MVAGRGAADLLAGRRSHVGCRAETLPAVDQIEVVAEASVVAPLVSEEVGDSIADRAEAVVEVPAVPALLEVVVGTVAAQLQRAWVVEVEQLPLREAADTPGIARVVEEAS